jgi:hypothetical protein
MNHSCNENDMEHALPMISGAGLDQALTLKDLQGD